MPLKNKLKPVKRLFGSRKAKGNNDGVNASVPAQTLSNVQAAVPEATSALPETLPSPGAGRTSTSNAGGQSSVATSAVDGHSQESPPPYYAGSQEPFIPHSLDEDPSYVITVDVELVIDTPQQSPRHLPPLRDAVVSGSLQTVRSLLQSGADVTSQPFLYLAAWNGHTEVCKLLLSKGAPTEHKEGDVTPLIAASHKGNLPLVVLLLGSGANVHARSESFGSSLDAACQIGNMEIVAVLLQKSPDVNFVWKSKGAPLHVACSTGNAILAALLVRYGANVNLPFGPEAKRPLFLACSLDQPKLDLVTFLLVSGADIHMGSTRNTPLNAACISGSLPLVKLLFTHGANQSRGRPPLHIASELNNLPLLQLLVDKGADPNVTYAAKTALSIACSATVPNILIIRYLLEEGATVQPRTDIHTIVFERALKEKDVELTGLFIRGGAWNDDHLRRACAAGDVLTAKFILEWGSQASVPGLKNLVTSLLVNAVRKDEFDLVQLLVQHGADVNVFNNEKRNSAHYAFHNTDSSGGGNTKLARYLLEQGARLSPLSTAHISVFKQAFQNDDLIFSMLILERTEDKQALFAAAREANNLAMAKFVVGKCVSLDTQFSTKVLCQIASSSALADAGHLPFIRLLLAHGATPDADNILAKAGANDNIELVELLLSSNANINQQYNGNTPLYAASIANHSRIVRILLSKGAQLDAGRSRPLGAMCSSGNVEIATMLLDAGAVVDTEDFASACTHGHLDILHLLFDAHPDLCSKFNFHLACQYRHFEVVKFLFDNGKADLEASYRDIGTALHAACLGGMFDIVRLLVEKGSDVCADVGVYGTSLQAACASDSQAETLTIVHFLLEHGAEVDPSTGQHGRPLKIASEKNNELVVRHLLNGGADLSADNYAVLFAACKGGHLSLVTLFASMCPSEVVSSGFSLRTAVSYGQTHLVKWFLDVKHFDPASPHPTDGTLLHLACSMGQLETAKLLIERQPLSCINTMHPTLGTPLMCASRSTNSSLVQYLLSECRADLHKWSPTYETAVEAAAKCGRAKNVEILVKRGADAGGVEKIAKEKGFRDVLDALANAKAWKVRNPDANGYSLYVASIQKESMK